MNDTTEPELTPEEQEAQARAAAETVEPWWDFLVVLPLAPEERTGSGLYLPTADNEQPVRAHVVRAGPEAKFALRGDVVLLQKYQGILYDLDGYEVMVIREPAVCGRVGRAEWAG